MVYFQSMDLNKLGQMLGSGNKDFLVEDAIFLTEKAQDFLRSRLGFHGDPMLNLMLRCWGERRLRVKDLWRYQFEIIALESFFVIMV